MMVVRHLSALQATIEPTGVRSIQEALMSEKSIYEKLIENTPLAVIVMGLFLVVVSAAGGWPGAQVQISEVWRIILAIIGVIVSGFGATLLWRDKTKDHTHANIATEPGVVPDRNRTKIEGRYYAEGRRTEPIDISYLSENLYRAKHPEWEGVGLFDGKFYYGIYIYNETAQPEDRGNVGAHKAKLREGGGALKLFVIELGNKGDNIEYEYIWFSDAAG
jgi:hypothetical protein